MWEIVCHQMCGNKIKGREGLNEVTNPLGVICVFTFTKWHFLPRKFRWCPPQIKMVNKSKIIMVVFSLYAICKTDFLHTYSEPTSCFTEKYINAKAFF